ncbi:MAG: DUF4340 domain-containing protein [Pseudomonas sp.]
MGRKSLWLLALSAGVLVLVYVWLQRPPQPVPQGREALLPALQGQVAKVGAIEVLRPGQPLVRLERKGASWVVPAKADYPVAAQPLAALLRALAAAKKVEAKTANPHLHGRLGLAEQGEAEQQATRLKLELQDGQPLALRLGKPAQQGAGQLVRLAGEDRVWLIDQRIELPASELEWLDRRVVAIPFASVKELELRYANGERLTLYRDAEGEANLKVKQLPQGKRLVFEAVANGVALVFNSLEFADAAPLAQVQFKGKPLLQFSLKSFADAQVEGAVYAQGEQHWLILSHGNFSPKQLPAKGDWAYRLEPNQYQALAKKLQDLLPNN